MVALVLLAACVLCATAMASVTPTNVVYHRGDGTVTFDFGKEVADYYIVVAYYKAAGEDESSSLSVVAEFDPEAGDTSGTVYGANSVFEKPGFYRFAVMPYFNETLEGSTEYFEYEKPERRLPAPTNLHWEGPEACFTWNADEADQDLFSCVHILKYADGDLYDPRSIYEISSDGEYRSMLFRGYSLGSMAECSPSFYVQIISNDKTVAQDSVAVECPESFNPNDCRELILNPMGGTYDGSSDLRYYIAKAGGTISDDYLVPEYYMDGCDFKGWCENKDGTGTLIQNEDIFLYQVTEDKELFALWGEEADLTPSSVVFDPAEGTVTFETGEAKALYYDLTCYFASEEDGDESEVDFFSDPVFIDETHGVFYNVSSALGDEGYYRFCVRAYKNWSYSDDYQASCIYYFENTRLTSPEDLAWDGPNACFTWTPKDEGELSAIDGFWVNLYHGGEAWEDNVRVSSSSCIEENEGTFSYEVNAFQSEYILAEYQENNENWTFSVEAISDDITIASSSIEEKMNVPLNPDECAYLNLDVNGGKWEDAILRYLVRKSGPALLDESCMNGRPQKDNASFIGWFEEKEAETAVNSLWDYVVEGEAHTLYAGWLILDGSINAPESVEFYPTTGYLSVDPGKTTAEYYILQIELDDDVISSFGLDLIDYPSIPVSEFFDLEGTYRFTVGAGRSWEEAASFLYSTYTEYVYSIPAVALPDPTGLTWNGAKACFQWSPSAGDEDYIGGFSMEIWCGSNFYSSWTIDWEEGQSGQYSSIVFDSSWLLEAYMTNSDENWSFSVRALPNNLLARAPSADVFCTEPFNPSECVLVAFDPNGGNWYGEDENRVYLVNANEPLDSWAARPEREEYVFLGWFDNPECSGAAINISQFVPTGDTTLYAGWTVAEPVTIWLDAQGGTILPEYYLDRTDYSYTLYGGSIALNGSGYLWLPNTANANITYAGHRLVEWNTSPYGNGTSYSKSERVLFTANTTLYAIWDWSDKIPATSVTFPEESVTLGVGETITLKPIVRPADASGYATYFEIYDDSVVSVNYMTGVIRGQSEGTDSITVLVINEDGSSVYATLNVVVEAPVVRGDANLDGRLSFDDADVVLEHVVGLKKLSDRAFMAANYNGDTKVDTKDAVLILQNAVGE